MIDLKSMYRVKKKRPIDPNAPPRPNLLSHEKVLKDTRVTIEQIQHENQQLRQRLDVVETRLLRQTEYLNALHNKISKK